MAILKNETQNGYIRLDRKILENKELKLIDRGMMATLMSLPNYWKFSIRGLESILMDKKTTIGNSLNRLEKMGYLTKSQRRNSDGTFGDEIIEIHQIPLKSPCADIQDTGNRDTENDIQYNTKIYNKQISKESDTRRKRTDDLTHEEYKKLVDEFGKTNVDYQLEKIKTKNYKNCMNYYTIREWCLDFKKKAPIPSKNKFNNFKSREYDEVEYEKMLLTTPLPNGGECNECK